MIFGNTERIYDSLRCSFIGGTRMTTYELAGSPDERSIVEKPNAGRLWEIVEALLDKNEGVTKISLASREAMRERADE